jgi:spermidine synthase
VVGRKLRTLAVCSLYLVSGLVGLVYEVTFSKYLSYVFGATAYASSAVLVAFMGGLSAGGLVVARWDARLRNRLFWYGVVEALIGVFCLASAPSFAAIGKAYVSLAHALPASTPVLAILRALLATSVVFVPAAAMGATLPLLSPVVAGEGKTRTLSTLYALNILGGAIGALVAAYSVIPAFGLHGTLRLAACANVAIGISAIGLSRARGISSALASAPAGDDAPRVTDEPAAFDARTLLLLAGASGLLVFAAEVVFVHLLALVIGTSVYAFGLMLAIFLLCLGFGAWVAPIVASRSRSAACFAASAAGLVLAGTAPVWDRLPGLFDTMAPYATTWAEREAGRALVAFLALCVPATAMGALFPIVLREAGRGRDVGAAVGRLSAVNTLGSIAGSIVGGFLLVPILGSQRSLLVLAAAYAALALASAPAERRKWVAGLSAVTLAFAIGAPRWDLVRLTSGANVYFESTPEPDAIEMVREDVHGGVTTVVRSGDLFTLYTNGKFQGNNGYELEAQRAFAHIPCLLAPRHERAFAIGLGTGTTLGTLAAYPFHEIEVAEISPAIAEAAKKYYSDINGGALDDPRVHLLREDGRNALLVSTALYDVIGIEISSIWFAGAANLYSREFYELAKSRLTEGGVLQQWVQLHHMRPREIATILASVRAVFPHVTLFANRHQGHILASEKPLVVDPARLATLEAMARAHGTLAEDESLDRFLEAVIDDEALDRFLDEAARNAGVPRSDLVSTDDNLYLEYRTPKNNVPDADDWVPTLERLRAYEPAELRSRYLAR